MDRVPFAVSERMRPPGGPDERDSAGFAKAQGHMVRLVDTQVMRRKLGAENGFDISGVKTSAFMQVIRRYGLNIVSFLFFPQFLLLFR